MKSFLVYGIAGTAIDIDHIAAVSIVKVERGLGRSSISISIHFNDEVAGVLEITDQKGLAANAAVIPREFMLWLHDANGPAIKHVNGFIDHMKDLRPMWFNEGVK